jgi:hypothetical protein
MGELYPIHTLVIHRCKHISSMAAVQVIQKHPNEVPVIVAEWLPRKFVIHLSMKTVEIWCDACYPGVTKLCQIEA